MSTQAKSLEEHKKRFSTSCSSGLGQGTLIERSKNQEELILKLKKLRDERTARQNARIELLKKINVEKSANQSLILNGETSKPRMSMMFTRPNTNTARAPKVGDFNGNKNTVAVTKDNAPGMEGKKTDGRRSVIPTYTKPLPLPQFARVSSILPRSNKLATARLEKQNKPEVNKVSKPEATTGNKTGRKFDMSALERLAQPKLTTKANGTRDHDNKKSNNVDRRQSSFVSSTSSCQPLNKRWTMASVERLSKPKTIPKENKMASKAPVAVNKVNKPFSGPMYVNGNKKQIITKNVKEISQKIAQKKVEVPNLRRSLSTVHFQRLGKDATKRCMTRTLSMGNMKHKDIEEEAPDAYVPRGYDLPVASEKKKSVKFMTPMGKGVNAQLFLNTPRAGELRRRLNDWLQKRGKSLSSYHHLQCFGIHHLKKSAVPVVEPSIDDENKENVEVEDDDSFNESMTGKVKDVAAEWRRASYQSAGDSPALKPMSPKEGAEAQPRGLSPQVSSPIPISNPVMLAALNDLHHLILEDYSWQQCAEWLQAVVRSCGSAVQGCAAYWECRAALEEKRGDFPRAVECYNNAIQQGAQLPTIEASLDHLLENFMKLNLSPSASRISGPTQQPTDNKLLDVKNVFKSTLIRFAIQQKIIMQTSEETKTVTNTFTATPVRRSHRLSRIPEPPGGGNRNLPPPKPATPANITASAKKPAGRQHLVQLCSSLRNVDEDIKNTMVFVPNKALNFYD